MLEKCFGNKQMIISSHVKKLIGLDGILSNTNVVGLRKLYDKIETEIRSLSSLGCASDTYGTMLIPIIMEKLPTEISLLISRKFGNEEWDIKEILKELEKELLAREKVVEAEEIERDDDSEIKFSAQALYSGNAKYCHNKNRNYRNETSKTTKI